MNLEMQTLSDVALLEHFCPPIANIQLTLEYSKMGGGNLILYCIPLSRIISFSESESQSKEK